MAFHINSYNPGSYINAQNYLNTFNKSVSNTGTNSILNALKGLSQTNNNSNQSLYASLGSIRSAADKLKSMANPMASLTVNSSSVGKTAQYSNNDVLSADVSKTAVVSNFTKTTVNVTQIAQGQSNKGEALSNSENSFGDSFELTVTNSVGKTTAFSVTLDQNANNKTTMQAMADKINSSGIGIKAALVVNESDNTSYLKLDSAKTGEIEGAFTVVDNSAAGLSNISTGAANAKYSVNGGAGKSSETNSVELISSVSATLKSTGITEITYKADTGAATSRVSDFIKSFNEFKDTTKDIPAIQKQLADLVKNYGRALGYSGINIGADGKLTIDENKLGTAISDGSFSKNFQGALSFGDKLNKITQNAYTNAYSVHIRTAAYDFVKSQPDPLDPTFLSKMFNDAMSSGGLFFNLLV